MSASASRLPVLVESPKTGERVLMDEIEGYLSSIRWPTQEAHARKGREGGSSKSKTSHVSGRGNIGGAARQAFVLGKVRKWDDHVHLHNSVHNKKHPELVTLLRRLMRTHDPRFRYNAVQLNRNVETKPHHDKRNSGSSYCLGLGDFRGGGLRIFSPNGTPTDLDNRRRWILYNGKKLLHASVPVRSGVRFALVFYTYKMPRKKKGSVVASRASSQRKRSN